MYNLKIILINLNCFFLRLEKDLGSVRMFIWKCMWISQNLFRQIIYLIMEASGNNVTTASLNKPINLFSQKEFGCFSMNCLYRILTDLVHLVVLMFLFKAVLFSICSGKISCNNYLKSKLNLGKSNLSELTNTQNVKRRIICFVFYGKRRKFC